MNIIKDIYRAVLQRKAIYVLLCVQFCISITSAFQGYAAWDNHKQYKIMNTYYTKLSDTYRVSISNDDPYYLTKNTKNILEELKSKTNYKIGTYNILWENAGDSDSQMAQYITLLKMSSEFTDIYSLDVLEGSSDFKEDKKQVLAGYNFKDKYKLKDKIKVNGQGDEYEIIGFLPKDAVFVRNEYLNDKLIAKDSNLNYISNGIYIQSKDDYKATKENILKITEKYGVLYYEKTEKVLFEKDLQEKEILKDKIMLSIGIIIFSFSMFLCSLIIIFNQSKRDFGIRIAYGAKKTNLYCYIIGQILFVYLVSMVLMFGLFYLATNKFIQNMGTSFWTFTKFEYVGAINLGIISLIILISIPIMVKIHKLTPSELIRSRD